MCTLLVCKFTKNLANSEKINEKNLGKTGKIGRAENTGRTESSGNTGKAENSGRTGSSENTGKAGDTPNHIYQFSNRL